jgi:hypothetical protein
MINAVSSINVEYHELLQTLTSNHTVCVEGDNLKMCLICIDIQQGCSFKKGIQHSCELTTATLL